MPLKLSTYIVTAELDDIQQARGRTLACLVSVMTAKTGLYPSGVFIGMVAIPLLPLGTVRVLLNWTVLI